jgi:hypothetical protein
MDQNTKDKLAAAMGIPKRDQDIMDAAMNHDIDCKCETCKEYWRLVGPEEDGNYGPFTKEEIEEWGIWCVRTSGSILGAAECWANNNGVIRRFVTEKEAKEAAENWNKKLTTSNVYYYARRFE